MNSPSKLSSQAKIARGHSSATLYEAAQKELKVYAGMGALGRKEADIALDPEIRAAWQGAKIAAPAFTVQGAGGDNLALHHAVTAAPEGHVIVADMGGAQFGHWGEVLAVAARHRGIAGLVIDGGVRDVDEMQELGFPVFSRSNSIRGTRKLFEGALGVEIHIGGVSVSTGDLIVGDADGLVAVPANHIETVLDGADQRVRSEADILEAIRSGQATLDLYSLR